MARFTPLKKAPLPETTTLGASVDAPVPPLDPHLNNQADLAAHGATPSARGHSAQAADLDAVRSPPPPVTESAATGQQLTTSVPANSEAKSSGTSLSGTSLKEPDASHFALFDAGETASWATFGGKPVPGAVAGLELLSAAAEAHAPGLAETTLSQAIDNLLCGFRMLARYMPKTADTTTDLTLSLQGEADAVGIDTNASGDMFARAIDKGAVSVAYGYATFSALAETTDGELAFASAFSDAFASGADFIISWTRDQSFSLHSDDGQFAKDVSSTFIIAIDFEAWDLRRGPVIVDGDSDRSFFGELDILPDLIAAGNVATFEVDVEAIGQNTFTDVAFSVLSVEDRLSSVSATADLGIA